MRMGEPSPRLADGTGRNFQFAGFYNPTDLQACDPPPPPPAPPPAPVSVGGDPIFHSGDSWLKFRLAEENTMTPLLAWQQVTLTLTLNANANAT